MESFLHQFDLSIYAILLLLIIYVNLYFKEEIYSYSNRLFRAIVLNGILITFLEIMSWVFDGPDKAEYYIINLFANTLLFMFANGVAGFWVSYIDYKIFGDQKRIRKRLWYQSPFILTFTIGIINLFYPIIFRLETDNVYYRLPGYLIAFALVYGMLVYAFYLTIRYRNQLKTNTLPIVMVFLLLPFVGSLVQLYFSDFIIIWPLMALAIVVIYLFLETTSVTKDYLTGLYNRNYIDDYVTNLLQKNVSFTVIMIDIDDYKKINDTHGHIKGDKTIMAFSKVLKKAVLNSAVVARYGGDEFIIISQLSSETSIVTIQDKIKRLLLEEQDSVLSKIRFSFGYATKNKQNNVSFDDLLVQADDNMYKDKAQNKNFKRRKSDN
jgi:diguanylate cyclase (GGDEF)-like protein